MSDVSLPRSKPRIALVVASLDIIGGHGVQARELVNGLGADGYQVTVVPVNPRFPRGLRWLRRIPFLRTVVNQHIYVPSLLSLSRVDVVHVFSASYWAFVLAALPALVVGRALGKRVVLHYHSGQADDHLTHWGTLVHPWLKLADVIVVPSTFLADVFARHGYRTQVIPNVVDLSQFSYRAREPMRARLLSNRNLESHYGVDVVLAAFAQLKRQVPEATLVVAGAGSEGERLRRLAGDGVRFTGPVAPQAMPALCDEADILVNASTVDNQPVSILEAFASGLVVVSTPTGAIADMMQARRGVLVPAKDPEAMATAILNLLRQPAAAGAMTRAARDYVREYTWPAVRDSWAGVYQHPVTAPASAAASATPSTSWTSHSTR